MEDSTDIVQSPKKIKKSRWGPIVENDSLIKKPEEECENAIPNGTENSSSENLAEEDIIKEKQKTIKITKITKAAKTDQSKELEISANPKVTVKKEEISPAASPTPIDSPTSSQLREGGFHGFENVVLSEKQSEKQDALFRILERLSASVKVISSGKSTEIIVGDSAGQERDKDGEDKKQEEDMTVDTGHASDSDSDQMEIDMGNDKDTSSRADSTEYSDKHDRTKDSDVDIMETDSVKSVGGKVLKKKIKGVGSKIAETDKKVLKTPNLKGSNVKVEYCGGCEAEVDDAEEGICCDGKCERWFHRRCSGLTQAEYHELGRDENAKWACNKCTGKPTSTVKTSAKPPLVVNKEPAKVLTPLSTKRKSISKELTVRTPKIDISSPAYLKPFDFGWKRELVFRSTNESSSRRQGDIYYYTPKGKKLRSLREISDHLVGTDLTQDNFTFWKEPIGIEDPGKEIIRDAKLKVVNKEPASSPSVTGKKATPKLTKTPKTTPKLTATVTPLESSNGSPATTPTTTPTTTPKASASVTPRVVLKGKTGPAAGPKFKVAPSKSTVPGQTQKIVISKDTEKTSFKQGINTGVRHKAVADSKTANPVVDNKSEEVTKLNTRNNFRRYGLLANAKTPRQKVLNCSSSSSSSTDSSDSSPERNTVTKSNKMPLRFPEAKISDNNKIQRCTFSTFQREHQGENSKVPCFKPSEKEMSQHNKTKPESNLVHPYPKTSFSDKIPLISERPVLQNCKRRPSPPEIQFRPSNPSSYGCQTSPLLSRRSVGPNMSGPSSSLYRTNMVNCGSPFETVLIVDTTSTETYMNSPKRKDESPLILNNSDCSIEIISVESLNSKEKITTFEGGYIVASPSQQSSIGSKMKKSVVRVDKNRQNELDCRRIRENSPVSVESSSTEEILVVDDDLEDNMSPPFLMRNSPPPKLTRSVSSPSQSPPSLQPILPPPPLLHYPPKTATDLGFYPSTSSIQNSGISHNFNIAHEEMRKEETDKKKKSSSDEELEMGMLPPTWGEPAPIPKPKEKVRPMDVCSIRCLPAMGLIPTLQCHVCLCLYHPECVGLEEANHRTIHSYKCKNCQMEKAKPATGNGSKTILPPPPLTPISTLSTSTSGVGHSQLALPKLQRITEGKSAIAQRGRLPLTKATSIVGGVTTWLPPSSTIQMRAPVPNLCKPSPSQRPLPPNTSSTVDSANSQPVQTLVSMDCKRYIVVPKHNMLTVSPATTSSAQVSDPVNTQITTATSDLNTTVSSLASQTYGPGGPILPKPQVPTSSSIIVNSPTSTTSAFQNPPGVILFPYITPQASPSHKDQQPQYIVVNGPSGLQPGNFIIGNIPQQQQLKLPTVPTSQPSEPTLESAGVKRPLESREETPAAKRIKADYVPSPVMQNFLQNVNYTYVALLHSFQYLKVQELLRASRVCHLWRDVALHKTLWETVRMKNSHVKDWEGFSSTLRRVGTKHLDLRKILMPDKQDALKTMWSDCVKALSKVNSLVKLDLCRCTSYLLEQIAAVCPQLECISAGAIKSNQLNLTNLKNCLNLSELKLKSQGGMEVTNVSALANLTKLKQLSLTTVKNMSQVLEVVGTMTQLESLELGDFTKVSDSLVKTVFSQLTRLRRLRLEKGQQECPTDTILKTISQLPSLVQLELINFDVKAGFDESLGLCSNIKILLIIPTYVTQSATTNHLVIEGVSKLSKTLNHFVWGLTLELLRVTDLFIDQWEMGQKNTGAKSPNQAPPQKKSSGDSIPILKPSIKDGKKPKEGAVTQVDVLQLPKLHKVLSALLPTTKIIILKVPFSATWRQTISNTTQ